MRLLIMMKLIFRRGYFLLSLILVSCNAGNSQNETDMEQDDKVVPGDGTAVATLGGGCFWCLEAIFQQLEGVEKVESGYSGGTVKNPSYREVCTGRTGHAEVVQIHFDPKVISYGDLLAVFFATHDPTTLNRQGADVGTQYRSAIYFHTDEQQEEAEALIKVLEENEEFDNPIVTEVTAFDVFYKAEVDHQDYYSINPDQPYCRAVIRPKLDKFKKLFKDRLKDQ